MRITFRLGKEDQERYQFGTESYTYDADRIRNLRARDLIALEEQLGGHSILEIEMAFRERKVLGLLGVMFIARRLSEHAIQGEAWEKFDPQVWLVEFEALGGAEDEAAGPTSGSEAV